MPRELRMATTNFEIAGNTVEIQVAVKLETEDFNISSAVIDAVLKHAALKVGKELYGSLEYARKPRRIRRDRL